MKRDVCALIFAMTLPTLMVWAYFVALAPADNRPNLAQQITYPLGKIVQFAFPILYLWWTEKRLPRITPPRRIGMGIGLGFGALVAVLMLVLYVILHEHTDLFARTTSQVRKKLTELGLNGRARYLMFGAALSLAHSLAEEYYWRWFVFGTLRKHVSFVPAALLSSAAFTSHHVIVLHVYFPDRFWSAVVPFSLGIVVGGFVWAWLFERAGSIYPSWLSHVIVDAAIIAVGYDLMWS